MVRQLRTILLTTLAVIAITAAGGSAFAGESAVLRGKVVDYSGKPIEKVSVVLSSPDDSSVRFKAATNKLGMFEFAVEDASLSYKVEFGRNGYVGMAATIELSAGSPNSYTFTMLTQKEIAEGKEASLQEQENQQEFLALNLYNDGVAAYSAGDLATARERFEAALEHDDSMPQALTAMCLIMMQQKEWKEAAEYAARTLAVEPTDVRALMVSYRANQNLGNDEEAARAAAGLQSIGKNSEVAGQIFNEAVDLYREKKVDQAISLFEQATELDPTLVNAYVALAGLYLNKGAFDDALGASGRALALDPTNTTALKYRFEACLRSENNELPAAIDALAAVDLPYVSKAVNQEALILFQKDQYEQSRKLVERLLELDPEDARANYVMGLILFKAGDKVAARDHLQVFVDASPNDPDAPAARTVIEAIE